MKRLLLLFVLALPSWGAVAFVQASNGGAQGSSTTRTTGATSTTAHNTLVVTVRSGSACSATTAVITDTAGNTFYQTEMVDLGFACTRMFIAFDITANASNVITMTMGAAQIFSYINCLEFSGVDRLHPRDMGFGFQAATATITSGKFSTFAAADSAIVIGLQVNALGSTWTAGTGYTIPTGATSPDAIITSQYKIVSALQTDVTTDATEGNVNTKAIIGISLNGSGSGKGVRHSVISK